MQYDLSLLRSLASTLPVERWPVERFEAQLDLPLWREGLLYLHPRVVLDEPHDLHPLHRAYIAEAAREPERPVLVAQRGGRVIDGMHLVVHRLEAHAADVPVVRVPHDVLERCTLPVVRSLVLCNLKARIVWHDIEGALLETDAPQVAYVRQGAQLLVRSVQFGTSGADKRLSKQFALDVSLVELNGSIFDGIAAEATDLSALLAFKVDSRSYLLRTLPSVRPEPYAKLHVAHGATVAERVWLSAMERRLVDRPPGTTPRTVRTPQGAAVVLEPTAADLRLPQASLAGHFTVRVPVTKEDDNAEKQQCVLCMENRADCKLSGCVHRFCRECLDQQSRHGLADCALCRKKGVVGVRRLLPLPPKRKIVKK